MASLLEVLTQIKNGEQPRNPEPIVKYTVEEIRSRRAAKIQAIKNPKGGGK